ncbi:probable receptor-like protein kinase At1g49730 isoform X1 [Pyrus x bretschneideri]|uniref:probable receptor-like protein kinase At1g49730 isoform X1 n=2 Tax=Pyrus x bretschneideri TaxID=225117 RepID=UPI00202E8714|nr:probable receptor-like protein kinase At1g49730 isoform X1 [Pyrus x bretschneideri]
MHRLIRKLRPRLLSWLRRSRSGQILFMKHFPYKDIKRATDGFETIMYTNSHIAAYKARFHDGGVVLIKEIRDYDQGKDVFYREVQLLGCLHHRHLLALRGFSTGHRRFLVFDNIERGSLKEHLNGNIPSRILCTCASVQNLILSLLLADPIRTPLNWRTRLQIAIGVVAALEYLLLFNEPPMYHVSINSSSIMLDENFNAKLSDVGLQSSGESYVTVPHTSCPKDCMGQECGNIMFQLGVLILELITGQSSENGGADLVQWIRESRFCSSIHKMLDPDLGSSYDSRELKSLLAVAKLCVRDGDKPKASMQQILRYLRKKIEIPRD